MSEERTSQVNKKHSRSHTKSRKHYAVLPYFTTPAVFVLIALLISIPVGKVMLNYAVIAVHKAQTKLVMDYNDLPLNDIENDDNTSLENVHIAAGQKLGTIVCDNAGLNASVYCGLNRVSLRGGGALRIDGALPGSDKSVKIAGYRCSSFRNVALLKENDVITFETKWGCFDYRVYDVSVQAKSSEKQGDLVLCIAKDSSAFSTYSEQQLYVYASPVNEEVLQ